MKPKNYIVIGLGTYGRVVATELTKQGHSVIAVDSDENLVNHIKDYVTTSYIMDATDEAAYDVLPLQQVESVIVAIGDNFGATIRIVAILKKNGVKHIFARAIDQIQCGILEAFQLDSIMTPEEEAAHNFVQRFTFEGYVESFTVDKTHHVFTVLIPDSLSGKPLSYLELSSIEDLRLLDVRRLQEHRNMLGLRVQAKLVVEPLSSQLILQENDELICYGTQKAYKQLRDQIAEM